MINQASKPTIVFQATGSQASQLAKEARATLITQYGKSYQLDFSPSKGFGIAESLLITITGTIASHFAIRLVEALINKRPDNAHKITIQVHRIDGDVIFHLPRDSESLVDHFAQQERLSSRQEPGENSDDI